ncbi:MAG: Holliday junction branch migration protein RuvA [Cyanobacteriota bacterium]|nr:Holliday junction branch migration protein RuvA [Cyanobacteriota bacterium]
MIGWLQGTLADPWQQDKRFGLLLLVHGVGYELQVSQRQWLGLPSAGEPLSLHVHTQIREDAWALFGFSERHERDLFRELVGVSGVGAQMAIGLLGSMSSDELVRAIVQADLRLLCRVPGVGKRTAERLAVELRTRLQRRFLGQLEADGIELDAGTPELGSDTRDEVQITLSALGYEALEIQRALRAVAAAGLESGAGPERWIAACLQWLSRDLP